MTCPGGGQPRFTDDSVRLKRISGIYAEDESKKRRKSHDNPAVAELYKEFPDMFLRRGNHGCFATQSLL